MGKRIDWIDVLKFCGIFAIYVGHFGTISGEAYEFVFSYHVPLFFFASGVFANKSCPENFLQFVWKKIKAIVLPYFFFSILSLIVIICDSSPSPHDILDMLLDCLLGIRNHLFASPLWFLPCLFVVSITFELLRRIFKKNIIILFLSVVLFYVAESLLPFRPFIEPSWFFNCDSAMYYLLFYAIGAATSYFLLHFSFSQSSFQMKILILLLGISSIIYSATIYFQKDFLGNWLSDVAVIGIFYPAIKALLLIICQIVLAKLLSFSKLLQHLGENTLYLCGNEYLVKQLIPIILSMIGLKLTVSNLLDVLLYSFGAMLAVYYILMPIEKRIYQRLGNLIIMIVSSFKPFGVKCKREK